VRLPWLILAVTEPGYSFSVGILCWHTGKGKALPQTSSRARSIVQGGAFAPCFDGFLANGGSKDRVLTTEEETRLLEAASEPVRSLIIIGLPSGLRINREGLTLTWERVDFVGRTLTAEAAFSKTLEMREVPLNSVAFEALQRLKARTPGPWVFIT